MRSYEHRFSELCRQSFLRTWGYVYCVQYLRVVASGILEALMVKAGRLYKEKVIKFPIYSIMLFGLQCALLSYVPSHAVLPAQLELGNWSHLSKTDDRLWEYFSIDNFLRFTTRAMNKTRLSIHSSPRSNSSSIFTWACQKRTHRQTDSLSDR